MGKFYDKFLSYWWTRNYIMKPGTTDLDVTGLESRSLELKGISKPMSVRVMKV